MANPLASSISKGKGSGEAAFLGESSFDPVKFTEGIVKQEQTKRLADQKQGELDMKSLLNDDFKANWDIDALNTFQPEIDAFRSDAIEMFKKYKGRIPAQEKMLLENRKKRIQENVTLSNKVYTAYDRNVQRLESAKQRGGDGLDVEESERQLSIFNNPLAQTPTGEYLYPEQAKEVQELYGGNKIKWRSANALKYGLVGELDRNAEFGNIAKTIKPSTNFVRDEKGSVVQTYNPQTGSYEKQMITEINPQDFESKITEIYETDSYKNKKLRKADEAFAEQVFSFDPQTGAVLYDQNDPLAVSVFQGATPAIRGMADPAKIKKELAKERTRQYLESFLPEASVKQLRDRRPIGRTSSTKTWTAGGGGDWLKHFTPTVTYEPDTTNIEEQVRKGLKSPQPFLPEQVKTSTINPKAGEKYVVINIKTPSKVSEASPLTLDDGEINVVGFKVDKGKNVLMDYYYKKDVESYDGNKKVNLVKKGYDISKNPQLLSLVANQYGFNDGKEFMDYVKNYEGKSKPQSTPAATSKPNQGAKGKSVSLSTIRSKVGTKGFEGYTEKELVDYYKSQGYNVK
jgi:hypothetical protein